MTNPDNRHPDIEIYLASQPISTIIDWLQSRFTQTEITQQSKKECRGQVYFNDHPLPFLIVDRAAPPFSSLWFDSPASPWNTDLDCAEEAANHFNTEVRCIVSGWQEGDEPDEWWQVKPGQTNQVIKWL